MKVGVDPKLAKFPLVDSLTPILPLEHDQLSPQEKRLLSWRQAWSLPSLSDHCEWGSV